jgi:hypothetical protein
MDIYTKRPDDRLDYDVDFTKWLTGGDTIVSVSVSISAGTGVTNDDQTFTGQVVKVWLLGGADGDDALVTVEATTMQGRVKEVSFRLKIREHC